MEDPIPINEGLVMSNLCRKFKRRRTENTEEYEYRYEWGTRGEYGMFNGYSITENTNENVVRYVALDEEVESRRGDFC